MNFEKPASTSETSSPAQNTTQYTHDQNNQPQNNKNFSQRVSTMREVENAIIRFSGDSGDGMQLVGTLFSNTSASMGNDISTFPDYPAEIRAPAGSVPGVSGFQVNIGSIPIYTPGDEPDVLVAMNPAALKANLKSLKRGGTIIVNKDAFDKAGLRKANYDTNPLETGELASYQVIEAPINTQVVETLADSPLQTKDKLRCKNFYALGIVYFMYGRDLQSTCAWIRTTFKKKPDIAEANVKAITSGYNFAETLESSISTYKIPSAKIGKGFYRQVNGNTAVAWGLMQAAEAAGLELFLGSYPITPATDILHELAKYKHHRVKTFQAEDEISAVCSTIGAAFAGALAATTTSGPGLALKAEAIGLGVMLELPMVIVDVQRGGPSTGLPTKTEQSDLNIAMYGRHGECPLVVLAAASPSDCYHMAYEASRIALEHMIPVILLTDGYLANGAEPWKLPDLKTSYNKINTHLLTSPKTSDEPYLPYKRKDNLARPWAIPGLAGYEHRIGGLEKDNLTGNISYDPQNHELMTRIRQQKIEKIQEVIPLQAIEGDKTGDVLVVSWGGTYGSTYSAVKELQRQGKKISLVHLKYINPFPQNLGEILKGFKRVVVPELNNGQMRNLLNMTYQVNPVGYNKIQGLPFKISELIEVFGQHVDQVSKESQSH